MSYRNHNNLLYTARYHLLFFQLSKHHTQDLSLSNYPLQKFLHQEQFLKVFFSLRDQLQDVLYDKQIKNLFHYFQNNLILPYQVRNYDETYCIHKLQEDV